MRSRGLHALSPLADNGGMARLLFIALVLMALHSLWNSCSSSGSVVRSAGSEVVVEEGNMEVHFAGKGDLSEWIMLFGRGTDPLSDVVLVGIEIRDARALYRRYPDFHMCKSPGAAKAQALVRSMHLVAPDPAMRRALVDAVKLSGKRLRNKGERVCVGVEGKNLAVNSMRYKPDGTEVTYKSSDFDDYHLVERVQVRDCGSLLREG